MDTAINLSKYIISKCIDDNYPISNLQLQKILYYIQKEFLKNNTVAFFDDIEAWQFGPVVPNVYYYFCGFGAMPISIICGKCLINLSDSEMIDFIVESKRVLAPWVLSADIQKKNGAWSQIYKDGAGNHKVIPIALIEAEE